MNTYTLADLLDVADHKKIIKGNQEQKYKIVDLNCIDPKSGIITNTIETDFLDSDKITLNNAEIIIPKMAPEKGQIVLPDCFDDDVIGTTELVPYTINDKLIDAKYLWYLLRLPSVLDKLKHLTSGTTRPRIETSELFELKIDLPSKNKQIESLKSIRAYEKQITKKRSQFNNLQKIIHDAFSTYILGYSKFNVKKTSTLNKPLDKFNDIYLRLGVNYNRFWQETNGKIINSTHNFIKLDDVIEHLEGNMIESDNLDEVKTIIELEDIEQRTGMILNKRTTNTINSSKILFGTCDFLMTKIRPYLGYVILNDDTTSEYLGSSELMPFTIKDKTQFLPKFLQYVLLSEDYLNKSKYLMAGKNQPRIHVSDILRLKIPVLDPKIQQCIISYVDNKWQEQLSIRTEINTIYGHIQSQLFEI